jgi:carbonic anhydrase
LFAAAVLSILILSASHAASPAKVDSTCGHENWGYQESNGPARWKDLFPHQCGNGREQSPINIVNPRTASLPPLQFSYGTVNQLRVENNGHSIEVTIPSAAPANRVTLRINGVDYRLVRFHFHTRSEHRIAGREEPIELHLVHEGPGGSSVAVGIFIEPGAANPALTEVWKHLTAETCRPSWIAALNLAALLPANLASYRYAGSLTTPTCGQGLQWCVLKTPVTMTGPQIQAFERIFYGTPLFPAGNRRPLQNLNGRVVLTDVR